jgi:tetratricopeptide (TPR) repeat protein
LTARDQQRLGRDVPANADAFERYLRANQLAQEPATWSAARTLYEDCLRLDPRYAPAWARLGRACWLLGKYVAQDSRNNLARSGAAFQAALELNPDLAVTHHLYTPFEVDVGRAQQAMVRLLNVAARHPHDAEVFAGLVHACRYCGLLDASLAAAGLAQRIDANVQTSVVQTHFQRGDYALVGMQDAVAFPVAVGCALVAEGRSAEAIDKLAAVEASTHRLSDFAAVICAVADERVDDGLRAIDRILVSGFRAPEELYHLSRLLARLGESQRAIATLDAAVSGGFYCASAMRRDPWLASIRSHATCAVVLEEAERRHQEAVERFVRAGGDTILGKR